MFPEGNIAVWVTEGGFGRNGERIDLGVVDEGVIYLRPSLGGGTVSYAKLQEFVGAGLKNAWLALGSSSLNGLSPASQSGHIDFTIGEVNSRDGNACLRVGSRGDEDGNVTSYAGANGPVAAALIVQMMRQVAIDLAIEFGGAKALSVFSHGGKLVFKQGKEVVELSAEEVAKKLRKKVDEINLDDIAKQLDGQTADNVVSAARLRSQLALAERLARGGKFVGPAGEMLQVGQSRVAVFDCLTGKVHYDVSNAGSHLGVLQRHGLPTKTGRYAGGFLESAEDGRLIFTPESGTFPYTDADLPGNILDKIRGTGVSIPKGLY